MGAVTYPNSEVASFISEKMVPLQVLSDNPLATEFNITWTPTLIVLDSAGKEHSRTVGFLPPDELIPSLLLGMAKTDFDGDRFADAMAKLNTLLKEFPGSSAAPEAVFILGVCGYKSSHNPQPLKDAYQRLKTEYPSSEWVKRAHPYSLL
jgi:hypothetical protein